MPEVGLAPITHTDPGIRDAVNTLRAHGVRTCQSCEGGPGHAYTRPTIEFFATDDEAWLTLILAQSLGLHVRELVKTYNVGTVGPDKGPEPGFSGTVAWALVLERPAGGYRHEHVLEVEVINNAVIDFQGQIQCLLPADAREFARRILEACDSITDNV